MDLILTLTGDQMQAICSAAPCNMLPTANIKINWIYKLCGIQHCQGFRLLGCCEKRQVYLFKTFLRTYHLDIQSSGRMRGMHSSKIPLLEVTVLSFKRSGNNKSATQHNPEHPNAQHQQCKNLVLHRTLTHWVRSSHCIKLLHLHLQGQSSTDCLTMQIEALRSCHTPATTRVGTLIVATIYLQLIQNRYMFWSFTVLHCSHQHCVQPTASDVEVVGYL